VAGSGTDDYGIITVKSVFYPGPCFTMSSDLPLSAKSRRTLGAIVFTDVANFTRRVTQDETLTLGLVRRDLAMIGRYCEKFDGRVVKNTGDGLLMYFSSAVQAVACAVKVQKILSNSAKKLPADQILKHRIGIHLGDVFLSDTDVLGDGVNIAARLQQQAEPGGICFSQTVYDVVKNRFGLKTTYVGPTELKHIREKIPVYKVITDVTEGDAAVPPPPSCDVPRRAATFGRQTAFVFAAGGVLVLAGLGVGVFLVGGNHAASPSAAGRVAANADDPAHAVAPDTTVAPANRQDAPHAFGLSGNVVNPGAAATAILHRFDRNGDGQIIREELPRRKSDEIMERADRDGNGRLTAEEIHEAAKLIEMHPRRYEGQAVNRPRDGGFDRPRAPGFRKP